MSLRLILLVAIGAILIMAASPAVAERIGTDPFHFVRRQFMFLPPAMMVIFGVSLLSPRNVRRLACIGLFGALAMMALVLASEALRKFGGDSVSEFRRNRQGYLAALGETPSAAPSPADG